MIIFHSIKPKFQTCCSDFCLAASSAQLERVEKEMVSSVVSNHKDKKEL